MNFCFFSLTGLWSFMISYVSLNSYCLHSGFKQLKCSSSAVLQPSKWFGRSLSLICGSCFRSEKKSLEKFSLFYLMMTLIRKSNQKGIFLNRNSNVFFPSLIEVFIFWKSVHCSKSLIPFVKFKFKLSNFFAKLQITYWSSCLQIWQFLKDLMKFRSKSDLFSSLTQMFFMML